MTGKLGTLSPSQELFAVGTSNIVGALSSAFPVAGSYSRSSINFNAGARSPVATHRTQRLVPDAVGKETAQRQEQKPKQARKR